MFRCRVCKTCHYLLIGKGQLYPRVRSAPHVRPLSVEHAPRHDSEQSTNYPETTIQSSIDPPPTSVSSPPSYTPPSSLFHPTMFSSTSSAFPPSQFDPTSSPVEGYPTLMDTVTHSTVPSPTSSLILTPSNAALASGVFPTNMPTVTPVFKHPNVGIIVGSVLGCLVAILLGVTICYCLFRKKRKRRQQVGYNNLPSEDERPYLQGDHRRGARYLWRDESAHNEQDPQVDGQGRYISLLPRQSGQDNRYSYPLTPNEQGHNLTFSSAGGEELQDHNRQGARRGDFRHPQLESHSLANDFAERSTFEITSGSTSSRGSVLSRARAAFGFAAPSVSMGYHSASSRTTVVDTDQISWPRQLQKWQRPTQPKRGAG